MLRGSWPALATAAVAVGVVAPAPAADAVAARSSLALRGPRVNTLGTPFQYTVSGIARGRASRLFVWQGPFSAGCARTSRAESRRPALLLARRPVPTHRRFSVVVRFVARNSGKQRLCAYLVSRRDAKTLARAEAAWTNVAPAPSAVPLQPAPVGRGLCLAKKFPDRTVYAQVAAVGVKCPLAESVAFGADGAQGAPYSRAGFSCAAVPQGPGSAWSSAWNGAYYAYSCSAGAQQLAFNWGAQYTYEPVASLQTVTPQS